MMHILYIILFIPVFGLSGCATLFTGSRDTVSIYSSPTGAKVSVDSVFRGTTPLHVELKKKHYQNILVEADGYVSKTYLLKNKLQKGYFIADLLIPLPYSIVIPVGLATDLITGASHRFVTDSVYVKLNQSGDSLDIVEQEQAAQLKIKDSLQVMRMYRMYPERGRKALRKKQNLDSLQAIKPIWNVFSIHATQPLVREWQFSYEKFIRPAWSLEAAFGVRVPLQSDTPEVIYEGSFVPAPANFFYPFTQSYYGSISVRKYTNTALRPYSSFYWSGTIFYRYNFHENEIYGLPAMSNYASRAYWDSKYEHIPGMKFTLGWRVFVLPYTSHINATIDIFSGVGLRADYENSIRYGSVGGTDDVAQIKVHSEPQIYKESRILPSIQMGIKIGFAWRR